MYLRDSSSGWWNWGSLTFNISQGQPSKHGRSCLVWINCMTTQRVSKCYDIMGAVSCKHTPRRFVGSCVDRRRLADILVLLNAAANRTCLGSRPGFRFAVRWLCLRRHECRGGGQGGLTGIEAAGCAHCAPSSNPPARLSESEGTACEQQAIKTRRVIWRITRTLCIAHRLACQYIRMNIMLLGCKIERATRPIRHHIDRKPSSHATPTQRKNGVMPQRPLMQERFPLIRDVEIGKQQTQPEVHAPTQCVPVS